MKRRILAIVSALVLASVGAVLLLSYVAGADRRALAGTRTVSVLVVKERIAKGTAGAQLGDRVQAKLLPAAALATGALSDVSSVSSLVTTADLQPGEQLLASRFAKAEAPAAAKATAVPRGYQRVSVLLEPRRVMGGQLAAGDSVAVYVSLSTGKKETHLLLDRALVTAVQGGLAPATTDSQQDDAKAAQPATEQGTAGSATAATPTGSVMVTFALAPAEAEKLVFAGEYQLIWLARSPEGAAATVLAPTTQENVFK